MDSPKLAYICFDVVPAPKGASVHITAFAKALAHAFGTLTLVTVSPTLELIRDQAAEQAITQIALPAVGKTLIDRVLYFRQQLGHWLRDQWFDGIQIRSIYEGFPIAQQKHQFCKFLIFEVNGLPSIELKYRYPNVADDRDLMQKLVAQEQVCLEAADLIITPSSVTCNYLKSRGVEPDKIRVIPNGVDLSTFTYHPPSLQTELDPFRLFYFGTLSAWQGVGIALEAVGLYSRDHPADLTVIGATRPNQIAALQKQAYKLGITDALHILEPVQQSELATFMHQADAIVAPLTANDRNLVQGCCPLKVLEGMASGTPVITSNLPVVQELGEHGTHFLALHPGSAKAVKDAMLILRNQPDFRLRLAENARRQVERHYTWQQAGERLVDCVLSLC